MISINCAGKSDIGLRRSNNEDAFVMRPDLGFIALADGMGGAASGEVASLIFVNVASIIFSKAESRSDETVSHLVKKVFILANEQMLKQGRENPEQRGMGCTGELLAFCKYSYILGHVGDSRTYLLRNGSLRQLTKDHSLLQDQVDRAIITASEARSHPLRSVIMRAVGIKETLAVDLIRGTSLPGDLFLLCSDGLTDRVTDERILASLSSFMPLQQKAEELVDAANEEGGHDNITVVLCEIE
jgi:PPM family protein phosphatase